MIHRFINGAIKLIAANVSGLVGESIQSASQTFCALTPLISSSGSAADDPDILLDEPLVRIDVLNLTCVGIGPTQLK